MLRSTQARSSTVDRSSRTVRLEVGSGAGKTEEARGSLLRDARGRVVGVDVDPDGPRRLVVLLGKHEDVATTEDARLTVTRDGAGDVISVVVHGVDG
jgi:hypothetical protein